MVVLVTNLDSLTMHVSLKKHCPSGLFIYGFMVVLFCGDEGMEWNQLSATKGPQMALVRPSLRPRSFTHLGFGWPRA